MRLIDGDALLAKMKCRREYVGRPSDPVCLVEDAPAVDAAPVIRCKDCKYYDTHYYCGDGFGWCERSGIGHSTSDDWFCADGEKRGEDE